MPRRKIREEGKRKIEPPNWREEAEKLLHAKPLIGSPALERGLEILKSPKTEVAFRELMDAAEEGVNWKKNTLSGLVEDISFVASMSVASTGRLDEKTAARVAEAIKLVQREAGWLLRCEPELVKSAILGFGDKFPKQDRSGPAHSSAGYAIGYLDSAHRQRFGPNRPVYEAILPLIQAAFPAKPTNSTSRKTPKREAIKTDLKEKWTIETIRTLASKNRLFNR